MIKKSQPQPMHASMIADSPYLYDTLVPKDHLLRQVKERVDFSFLYDVVVDKYSAEKGRRAIAPKPSGDGKFTTDQFRYDAEAGTVTCPSGEVCTNRKENRSKGGFNFYFAKATCAMCPLREKCLSKGELAAGVRRGRSVYINAYRQLHDAAKVHQETEEHKQAMHKRLAIEHKAAEMLHRHGLRHARYRGLQKMLIQAYLTAVVVNLKRLVKLMKQGKEEVRQPTVGELCLA